MKHFKLSQSGKISLLFLGLMILGVFLLWPSTPYATDSVLTTQVKAIQTQMAAQSSCSAIQSRDVLGAATPITLGCNGTVHGVNVKFSVSVPFAGNAAATLQGSVDGVTYTDLANSTATNAALNFFYTTGAPVNYLKVVWPTTTPTTTAIATITIKSSPR